MTQRGDPWAAAAASVGAARDHLVRVKQVHGKVVHVLHRGRVPDHAADERPGADAIVSDQPGLALAVTVADCVPIVIADRGAGAAAAIHAGWRGTCAGVVLEAVRAMAREFGADPNGMTAAIGPAIGPENYAVGEALAAAFLEDGHPRDAVERWFHRSAGTLRLDLWTANRDQLIAAGLRPDRIFACGLSTLANPGVFDSFRRDGEAAGRMAAIVVVPGAVWE